MAFYANTRAPGIKHAVHFRAALIDIYPHIFSITFIWVRGVGIYTVRIKYVSLINY